MFAVVLRGQSTPLQKFDLRVPGGQEIQTALPQGPKVHGVDSYLLCLSCDPIELRVFMVWGTVDHLTIPADHHQEWRIMVSSGH